MQIGASDINNIWGERQEGKNMRGENSQKEGKMEREKDLPEQTGIVR